MIATATMIGFYYIMIKNSKIFLILEQFSVIFRYLKTIYLNT